MKSGKDIKEPQPLSKEFKWMGFKSHMMATMAQWRELDHLTDAVFHCVRNNFKMLIKFEM